MFDEDDDTEWDDGWRGNCEKCGAQLNVGDNYYDGMPAGICIECLRNPQSPESSSPAPDS